MKATKEQWNYGGGESVWVGKYLNSQNSLHWHSDCELISVEHGTIDIIVNGVQYRLTDGDCMFIDSQSIHRITAVDTSSLLKTIIFDCNIIKDFSSDAQLISPKLSDDYGVSSLYDMLLRELTDKPPLYTYKTATRVKSVLLEIFGNEPFQQKKKTNKANAKIKALIGEIHANISNNTLDDAAQFMGMNTSYLSRFFAANTGMHFMRYVNCVRVEKAVDLLSSGEYTVTEIADMCGFGTIRNFNRIFKLLTGYAPTAIPDDFFFATSAAETNMRTTNPTLFGCVLVEASS